MKRFSGREMALMCVPILIPLAVLWWMNWLERPSLRGIRVVEAGLETPTPSEVAQGADVGVSLELEDEPDDDKGLRWKAHQRLVAGDHLLWTYLREDAKRRVSQEDVERRVSVSAFSAPSRWYAGGGTFDLDSVPAQWGEVALLWDVELIHARRFLWHSYNQLSRRSGRIVVRRAGEKLVAPRASRDAHLKLLRVEIRPPKITDAGRTFSYPVYFYFERDRIGREAVSRSEEGIMCNYQVRARNGSRKGFKTFSSTHGSDELTRWLGNADDAKATVRHQYPIVKHTIDVDRKLGLPGETFVDWKILHGDFWPMRLALPFSDATGRVLVGTSRPETTPTKLLN